MAVKQQRSKRAREIRKEALAAGLPRYFSHPSHIAGVQRCARRYRHRVYLVSGRHIKWWREGARCMVWKW